MQYQIIRAGESRSFPEPHAFVSQAAERAEQNGANEDRGAEGHVRPGVLAQAGLPREPQRHRKEQQPVSRVGIVPPRLGQPLDRIGEDPHKGQDACGNGEDPRERPRCGEHLAPRTQGGADRTR